MPANRLIVLSCILLAGCPRTPQPVRPSIADVLADRVRTYQPAGSTVGIAVFEAGCDRLLFGWNETTAMVPASNLKLFTTACALENWTDSLADELEALLGRSKMKAHRLLSDPVRAESLGRDYRHDPERRFLLVWTNQESDNALADLMLARLSRGSTGQAAIERWLDRHAIAHPGLCVIDGSGRSVENRACALTLASALRAMLSSDHAETFRRSLPGPGSGTLVHRGLGLGSRVRAKTGYIRNAFSLCGYLDAGADTFCFAFIANDCPKARPAYRLFVRLLLDLYRWSTAPGLKQL